MALGGFDWQVNDRLNIFGLLPSNLMVEKRIKKRWYGGLYFRTNTSSFAEESSNGYFKLQDNHIGLFTDFVIFGNFVWNLEAGHTVLRSFKDRAAHQFPEVTGDSWVFRTAFTYRIRLR